MCNANPSNNNHLSSETSMNGSIEPERADFSPSSGIVNFAPLPAPCYRYSLTLQDGKLRIWLEHCKNKKQWCTKRLGISDYINNTNAIPNTNAVDYVKASAVSRAWSTEVHHCTESVPITLKCLKSDMFQLRFMVNIQAMDQAREVTYSFALEPISLERIDVMESKMRDLETEVSGLRSSSDQVATSHELTAKKLNEFIAVNALAFETVKQMLTSQESLRQKLSGSVDNQRVEMDTVIAGHAIDVCRLNKVVKKHREELNCIGVMIPELAKEVTNLYSALESPLVMDIES